MLLGLSIACGVVRVASGQDQAEPGTLKGHLGAIAMGVLTPDGGRAITASTDQTARVWDLASGATIREYAGHTGPLYSLALSGDGRTLVTGAQDNSLRVWDVPQTVPLLAIAAHGVAVTGVAGTADGKVLVSVGADNKLRVWDTTQLDVAIVSASTIDPNAISKVLSGHDAAITSVAVRPDGNLIATGDVSGRILFWSPFLEQPQGKVEGPGVVSLAFNGNNQQTGSSGNGTPRRRSAGSSTRSHNR
jgi:WD40 repeat protein